MNVQCSWKVSDGRPISDAIFYNRETEDADLEDAINVENCVFLKAPDNCEGLYPTIPACQLLICCEPPHQITRIIAICEARVIEIYGHHGEYLKTVFNAPLDDSDNLSVYRGDVILDKPLSVCSVKFVNLESPNEMWLFGVKIHTDKIPYSPLSPGNFMLSSVIQQKLDTMGNSIEDKDTLKGFTDALLKMGIPTALQQIPPTAYMKLINENLPANWHNSLQKSPSSDKTIDTVLTNAASESQNEDTELREKDAINANIQASTSHEVRTTVSTSTSPVFNLSQCASTQTEESYTSLEENLKSYFNEQIQVINKKFLEIETKLLCKLDEIESFVKPQGLQNN